MTLKEQIKNLVLETVEKVYDIKLPRESVPVTYPDQKAFGDYSTPAAMGLAKSLKKNPREIAQSLSAELGKNTLFSKVEVAGAGFINFFIADTFLNKEIRNILNDDAYGANTALAGQKILLEFVSANPTGPLHIGHGRWAAIGASMASIMQASGAIVSKEFYINDAGNQINLLRESVEAVRNGKDVPENGYHGAYIHDVAKIPGDPAIQLLEAQKQTLAKFRVIFDCYFSEKSLHVSGAVAESLEFLKTGGYAFENEGALWLKTTAYGDDKDRVLVKADGEYTYFAVDIAYHLNKVRRDYNTIINILGADHHGYVKRIEAAVKICAERAGKKVDFSVLIGQLVSLFRDGEPVRMSKRTGEMVTLEEVIDEIGADAARYYLVMRKADTPLDFDIETAKKQSDDNPVFYVQYAHARISGILRNTTEYKKGDSPDDILDSEEARDLAIACIRFPEITEDAAIACEPHRIPLYLESFSNVFHRFYNHQRVLTEDIDASRRRIQMVYAAQKIIRNGLALIGVSAPDKM